MTPAPEPNHFLQFWIIIGFIAMILGQIISIIVMLSNRKQRREVNFAFEPATKSDFDAHIVEDRAEHKRLQATIEAERAGAEQQARVRSAGMYAKIDQVRKELTDAHGELRGEISRNFQDTERTLGRIEGKIQSLTNGHIPI